MDRATGEVIGRIDGASRTPGFLEQYEWRFDLARVAALARRPEDHVVLLCGSTANEAEVWPMFRSAVYLAIDDATLAGVAGDRRAARPLEQARLPLARCGEGDSLIKIVQGVPIVTAVDRSVPSAK